MCLSNRMDWIGLKASQRVFCWFKQNLSLSDTVHLWLVSAMQKDVDFLPMAKPVVHLITRRSAVTVCLNRVRPVAGSLLWRSWSLFSKQRERSWSLWDRGTRWFYYRSFSWVHFRVENLIDWWWISYWRSDSLVMNASFRKCTMHE